MWRVIIYEVREIGTSSGALWREIHKTMMHLSKALVTFIWIVLNKIQNRNTILTYVDHA
jgi:hypothetical protein